MNKVAILPLLCLAGITGVNAQDPSAQDFPGLPVSAISEVENQASPQAQPAKAPDISRQKSPVSAGFAQRALSVKPGVNEVIPIALGHPNRIMLPFDSPKIRTTSNAGFEVDGRVLYVTSTEEGRPVTAFINDAGNPDIAMSVTFVPSRMPPVEMSLSLDTSDLPLAGLRGSQKAEAWERSQPYIETIRGLLREVAIGKVPSGYTINAYPSLDDFTGCYQEGLQFEFYNGQSIEGHNLIVNVGTVENVTGTIIEFREPACAGELVKAVAAWPRPILRPGEKSEVYVVSGIRRLDDQQFYSRRSLIEE